MTPTATPRAISPQELARLQAGGTPLAVIDVRTPAEYDVVHAPAARLVPLDKLDPASLLAAHPAGTPLYILCKSGGRARKAQSVLAAAGCADAIVVEGGTDAWVAAGLPVVRAGGKVISLERQVRIAAGLLVLTGVVLALIHHPYWALLSGGIGAGLIFAGITDTCGMGMLLAKMPWNSRSGASCCNTCK